MAQSSRVFSFMLILPVFATLGGCAGFDGDWLRGKKPAAGPTIVALEQDPTVWCYRTLGQPDCYATEQPNESARLLGAFIRKNGELIPADAPAQAAPTPQGMY
jgi:hypothetical protein